MTFSKINVNIDAVHLTGFLVVPVLILLTIAGCDGSPLPSKLDDVDKQPLQTSRPYNIAHRGSNGEFPEETAAAYMRAIEEGADFIETDILASKDGVLICSHDVTLDLDNRTNIANFSQFADRKRTYEVQGVNMTRWFVGKFPIITFKEYISIALDAKRVVGIYPEIKNPVFINKHIVILYLPYISSKNYRSNGQMGKKFEDKFVETLMKFAYKGSYMSKEWLKQPAFVQSFAPTSLTYIANLTDLPKIFLIDDVTVLTEDTNQTYYDITSDSYLDFMKNYVVGIGPWKDTIITTKNNYLNEVTDLVAKAHARGLQAHIFSWCMMSKICEHSQ
ncbi:glycerophosphodiester phosphodiesterase GDPD6-like [Quercus robur]|uniref:glycerophosphodiester phosphodiesterase GDPD6-like n=1 Tax=Quercus robur TaxID=38942 RepID=UPI002161A559|nr:glycerophosphodiester phosphodiesterase GDPD6-like [Quercus robur]